MAKYQLQHRMNSGMVYVCDAEFENDTDLHTNIINYSKTLSTIASQGIDTFFNIVDAHGQHHLINVNQLVSVDYIKQQEEPEQ